MTIVTLIFFAIFGLVSGFVEHSMRQENIAQGVTNPLDHGKLVERRAWIGFVWLMAVTFALILMGQFSWHILLYIPMGMGTFGIFHRLTINYAANRGPWYLGVDSKIDQFALKFAGMVYIYPNSASHYEAWDMSKPYRQLVKKAAMGLYFVELAVAVAAAYITL